MSVLMRSVLVTGLLCFSVALGSSGQGIPSLQEAGLRKQKQERTLLIGCIPEQNLFKQMERHEPLARYLSSKTDVNVKGSADYKAAFDYAADRAQPCHL
jgi:ABC-type phosphate/phosphonate transport system substrate-binding protein